MKEIIDTLLSISDELLDPIMKEKIRNWSSPIRAVEILEVLDMGIFGSLASGSIITLLQYLYSDTLVTEKITHEEVVSLALWRGKYLDTGSERILLEEELYKVPEGSGMAWVIRSVLGVEIIDLNLRGEKAGWLIPGEYGDKLLWTGFDNRHKVNGCNPIVMVGDKPRGSLSEVSKALIMLILQ